MKPDFLDMVPWYSGYVFTIFYPFVLLFWGRWSWVPFGRFNYAGDCMLQNVCWFIQDCFWPTGISNCLSWSLWHAYDAGIIPYLKLVTSTYWFNNIYIFSNWYHNFSVLVSEYHLELCKFLFVSEYNVLKWRIRCIIIFIFWNCYDFEIYLIYISQDREINSYIMLEAFHIWQVSFLRKTQVLLLDFELQNRMLLFELSYIMVSINCLEGSPSVLVFFPFTIY